MRRHDGASSDGYLAHVFRHAAKQLFDEDVGEVTYRTLRSVSAVGALSRARGGRVWARVAVQGGGRQGLSYL